MGYLAIVNVVDHGNGVIEEIYHDGTIIWRKNGLTHRVGGPAILRANGELQWFEDGKPHRLDGPAQIDAKGNETWFINGSCLMGEELQYHKDKYNLNKELNTELSHKEELDKVKKPKI
jgi:hypothetical protein